MEEQSREQKTTLARRIFIGIDLLVVVSVLLLMPKWLWELFPFFFYLIYFRANLSVMMLQNEKRAIWGALITVFIGVLPMICAYFNVGHFRWYDCVSNSELMRYTEHETAAEVIGLSLFCWFYFTPLFNGLGQLFSKRRTNEAKWRDIFVLTYYKHTPWKKEIGNLFLFSLVLIVAQGIGLRGEVIFDSIWSIPVAMLGGWLLLRSIKFEWKNIPYMWIYVAGVTLLFSAIWASQFLYGEKLFVLVTSYTLGIITSCYLIIKGISGSTLRKLSIGLSIGIVTFIILPILTFGYNIFSGIEYVRIGNFQNKAMQKEYSEFVDNSWQRRIQEYQPDFYVTRGVFYIKDCNGNVGLRDRKKVIIPVEYEAIEDCGLPYYKVKKNGLWGVYDDSGAYMYKNYYFVTPYTRSGIVVECRYAAITPVFIRGNYVMATDNKGMFGVLNLYAGEGTVYFTNKKGNATVSKIDQTLVVPFEFSSIQYITSGGNDYFLASKKIDDKEVFWLYNHNGRQLSGNSTAIALISDNKFAATDIYGNTHIVFGQNSD